MILSIPIKEFENSCKLTLLMRLRSKQPDQIQIINRIYFFKSNGRWVVYRDSVGLKLPWVWQFNLLYSWMSQSLLFSTIPGSAKIIKSLKIYYFNFPKMDEMYMVLRLCALSKLKIVRYNIFQKSHETRVSTKRLHW